MSLTREQALRAYATAVNRLDANHLLPLLAPDFHYASQRVFSEITSKAEFAGYFIGKLDAIRRSGQRVWAEMGHLETEHAKAIRQAAACHHLQQPRIVPRPPRRMRRRRATHVQPLDPVAVHFGEDHADEVLLAALRDDHARPWNLAVEVTHLGPDPLP